MTAVLKEEAEKILADVKADHQFILNNGVRLKNLYELSSALAQLEAGVFVHHVNRERNDFSSWVRDVHQDKVLASSIAEANGPFELRSVLLQRISELESSVAQPVVEEKKQEKKPDTAEIKAEIKAEPAKPTLLLQHIKSSKPKFKKARPAARRKQQKLSLPVYSMQSLPSVRASESFFSTFCRDMSILIHANAEEVWNDILDLLFIKRKK